MIILGVIPQDPHTQYVVRKFQEFGAYFKQKPPTYELSLAGGIKSVKYIKTSIVFMRYVRFIIAVYEKLNFT